MDIPTTPPSNQPAPESIPSPIPSPAPAPTPFTPPVAKMPPVTSPNIMRQVIWGIIVGGIIVALAYGSFAYYYHGWPFGTLGPIDTSAPSPTATTACTQEAKICPDGSSVGRTGPLCEFAACPGETPTPTADWKTYTNTQYGFEVKDPYPVASADVTDGVLHLIFDTPPGETRAVISVEASAKTAQQWFDSLPKTATYTPVAIRLTISGEPAIRVDSGEFGLSQVAIQHDGYFYLIDGNMIEPLIATLKFTK